MTPVTLRIAGLRRGAFLHPEFTMKVHARLLTVLAFATALVVPFTSAYAQSVFGAAEVGDDNVSLYLLGASVSAGGYGWKPYASVTAYNLQFPGTSRNVVVPSVGLENTQSTQSVHFGVGYAFADSKFDQPVLVGGESGKGVVGSFGWDYWGAGNRESQVLASYNFGTQFLWTRGRMAVPLAKASPIWVGGEAGIFGGGSPSAYLAQFGPMAEWRFSPQFRLGLSAGLKAGISNASGSATYGRLEFLWLPRAR